MLRWVVLLNAVVFNALRAGEVAHPAVMLVLVLAMAGWTVSARWLYATARRRGPLVLGADLALAVALLVLSPWVRGTAEGATVPGFWVSGALMAWAIHYRTRGGVLAGVLLAALDLGLRGSLTGSTLTESTYGNAFLLVVGGPVVGYLSGSLQRMADARDRAEREAAAASERARLARAVHDGVLQVLALVQRRGADLGPAGADLGRLAAEQETTLRALIRAQDSLSDEEAAGATGQVDLAGALVALGTRPGVEVVTPGTPVPLPARTASEIVATVEACLDNVSRHVGERAPAWVVLEDLGDRVEVCVRDEGLGIEPGRLEAAEREGRLGVSGSIRGRVEELGGRVELDTGPHGTEWTIVLERATAS